MALDVRAATSRLFTESCIYTPMFLPIALLSILALTAASAQTPQIVKDVRAAIDAKNFTAGQQALDRARRRLA